MNAMTNCAHNRRPRLPEDFRFSQTSLQVYDDCKRRFGCPICNKRLAFGSGIAHRRTRARHASWSGLPSTIERAEAGVPSDDVRNS